MDRDGCPARAAEGMSPLPPAGWILYAALWVAGPITGYTAARLIVTAWERQPLERNDVMTAGLFGGLFAIAATLLMFAEKV